MLKNIIILENDVEYQCNKFEDVVKKMIDKNYYNFSNIEKHNKLKMLAIANSLNKKLEIVENAKSCKISDLDNKIIIKDEYTYILSLLNINQVVILEKKGTNLFTKKMELSNFSGNYIIVNKFAKLLLQEYLKEEDN